MSENITNYTKGVVSAQLTTIASGQSESGIIDTRATTLKTITLPPVFNGNLITFKISSDGVNFHGYRNRNDEDVSVSCTADFSYGLGAIDFLSIQYMKLVSSAVEAADREIELLVSPI